LVTGIAGSPAGAAETTQALDAEGSVLAAMLLDPDAVAKARELLDPADFYRDAHRLVFLGLLALADTRTPCDLVTLADMLKQRGDLDAVGGPAFLAGILEFATTSANLEQYARIVREHATRRRLRALGLDLQLRASDPTQDAASIVERLSSTTRELAARSRGSVKAGPAAGAVVTRLAAVEPLSVDWLWRGRIALATLTIFDGDPGLGKSTVMLDIAARLSRGDAMADGSFGPGVGGTVILSYEDDLARVIRPRLEAAGADLKRIATVGIPGDAGMLREPEICAADLVAVERAVSEVEAKLVIVDPLMAALPTDVNAHRDQDVRRALAELRRLAERTSVAVVVIRHLNKSGGGNALYRGGGSIGIIAAARSAFMLARDPDDPTGEYRVLAMLKSNLAAPAPALRLRLLLNPGDDRPCVRWEGSSPHSADSLLAVPGDPEDRSALEDAVEFLQEALTSGRVPTHEVLQEARRAGIRDMTLRRAKARLKVRARKVGRPGEAGQHWTWELPAGASEGGQSSPRKGLNSPDLERLQVTDGSKPLCVAADAEVPQVGENEHLRLNAFSSTPCPACGGEVLRWGATSVCRACHRRVESNANSEPENLAAEIGAVATFLEERP
jgi:replicative DNA helicase